MESESIQEDAQAVRFWLDPANQQVRKELAQHKPELESWLSIVGKKIATALDDEKSGNNDKNSKFME